MAPLKNLLKKPLVKLARQKAKESKHEREDNFTIIIISPC